MSAPGEGRGWIAENLAVLEQVLLPSTELDRIRDASPASGVELLETPSGHPTARSNGVWIYSRYDPVREATRLVDREIPRSTEICIFENFGLGYHVEALLERRPEARAVVIEPDISWFRTALEARDLRPLLRSSRVTLLLDSSVELLGNVIDDVSQPHVVRLRALEGKDTAYFQQVAAKLRSIVSRHDINQNTLARFGRRWVRNLIGNIRLIPEARGVEALTGAFNGLPCLLLAAGPSLDELLPTLPELRRRFLIVAVDTSYRAALAAGVVPDVLVVVDPQYWNSRHLDGCPLESTMLVSESSTYPAVFHRPLDNLFFCGSLFPLGQYLERSVGGRGLLGAGGSVSTTAWDLARLMGCAPVICGGLDLGYPRKRTHFHGGFFEERMHVESDRLASAEALTFHLLHDAAPQPVENNAGSTTLTDERLIIYRWWFEEQLHLHPETPTFNLSGEGVRIDGMPPVALDALLDYPDVRPRLDARLADLREARSVRSVGLDGFRSTVFDLISELRGLTATANEGSSAAEALERELTTGGDGAPLLSVLDEIDRRIARQTTKDIAGFLLNATAREIIERREPDEKGQSAQLQAVSDSRQLYRQIAEAASYHVELLERAVGRLHRADQDWSERG